MTGNTRFDGLRLCKSEADPAYKQILSLEKKCFSKADSWRGDLGVEIRRRNTYIVYLQDEDQGPVAAYMLYTIHCLTAHIAKLAVCPNHRRQGLASKLVDLVVETLRVQRRIGVFSLHVAESNFPARGLYAKAGFVENGFLEDYYSTGRHAYKMIRDCSEI